MYDVISIGAATIDIFAKSDSFIKQNDYLSLIASSKNEITQSLICSGGGATNSSVAFSRLGFKSACLSLIGFDHLHHYITQDLKNNHVSTSLLVKSKKDNTDFSIILVAKDGHRSILTQRGFCRLEEKYINWNKLNSKWFYITSLEGNLGLLEKIIGFAQESGIKIAFNPGKRELEQKKQLIPLLKYIDFLLLNRAEMETLSNNNFDDGHLIETINKFGSKITAITDGRQGAYVFLGNEHHYSPIIKTNTIDETGAGDSFGSAFVAALMKDLDLKKALHWGVKNSSSVVSYLGAKTGLLTIRQINKKKKIVIRN